MNVIGKSLALAATVILAGTTLGAAQTPNHFRGNACIQTASAGCAAAGWGVGNCAAARFTPPNYGGNSNRTGLSLFWGAYAQQFTLPVGTLVGTVLKAVNVTQIGNGASTYSATARIPSQAPANPAPAIFLSSLIDINAFDSEARTCNIRLRFTGQRFPLP